MIYIITSGSSSDYSIDDVFEMKNDLEVIKFLEEAGYHGAKYFTEGRHRISINVVFEYRECWMKEVKV